MDIEIKNINIETDKPDQEARLQRMKAYMEYNNNYKDEHYDRVTILVPKGMKEEIRKKAKEENLSVSSYILSAVKEKMENAERS